MERSIPWSKGREKGVSPIENFYHTLQYPSSIFIDSDHTSPYIYIDYIYYEHIFEFNRVIEYVIKFISEET